MYLSARARLIMEQLFINNQPVIIDELAEELSVSERTIRRDLKEVEETLFSYHLTLKKESGILTLEGTASDQQKFRWQLMDLSYNEYSPDERQQQILKTLLKENDGVKLVGLANDLNVTISTISSDLTKIEERLPKNVTIERKRGSGVYLHAGEIQKRNLMSIIFGQQFPNYQLLKFFQEQSREAITTEWIEGRLLDLVSGELLTRVEQSVRKWRKDSATGISDEAYANLIVHISISIERLIEGNFIQPTNENEQMSHYSEFETAKQILADILEMESEFVPEGEAAYVTSHLRGIKTREGSTRFIENEELQVMSLTKKLIEKVEAELKQTLPKESLVKGLIAHLRPTLRRLEQDMRIYNPLIQSIKQDYPELFVVVRRAFDQVYQEKIVPDEEIGYLVLHFGSVILQLESTNSFSGLVVCASGIGTSRMLVTRLRQQIPQLKKLETVSLFELGRKRLEKKYDVIISTIDLGQVDFDYFLVSPILSERELSQIAVFLKSLQSEHQRNTVNEERADQLTVLEAMNFLEQKQLITSIVLTILKNFKYAKLNQANGTTEDTIRAICTQLLEKDPTLNVETLINTFIQNDNKKVFTILGTKIGVFHARNECINEPFFQLFALEKSVVMEELASSDRAIDRIVLLLVPEKFSQEGLEVVSYISTLFVDNTQIGELLEYGTTEEISIYFVQKLLTYVETRGN